VNPNNLVTAASNYGTQIEHWNGLDFIANARMRQGLLLQGGVSTGRTSTDSCAIQTQLPEIIATTTTATPLSYCHVDTPFLTQVKGFGSYTISKWNIQVSGSFQSIPGPLIAANYNVPNALVVPSLGRSLSGNSANVTVNLMTPDASAAVYGERMNQLDLRVGKILKYGRTRTAVNLDVYNALNRSTVLQESTAYAIFRQPQVVLLARFAKITMQFDF
jgi:hypothetical protein